MRRLIGNHGKGGGHGTMAGGFADVPKTASDGGRALERLLSHRFVEALKKNPDRLQPLSLVPTAATAEPSRAAANNS